jgi:hypothetical protein
MVFPNDGGRRYGDWDQDVGRTVSTHFLCPSTIRWRQTDRERLKDGYRCLWCTMETCREIYQAIWHFIRINYRANTWNPRDDKDLLTSIFKFRTTHIGKLAGGAPDAVVGCYIDPREPIRCSFNNMLLLGYEPPLPIVLNVTEVKGGAAAG